MVQGPAAVQAGAMTETPLPPAPGSEGPRSDGPRTDGPRTTAEEARDLGRIRRSTTDRKVAGVAGGLGLHLGVAGHLQVLLADGFAQALADQFAVGLVADLGAEALFDDLGRDLALAEALDVGGARQLAQAVAHHAFEALGREADGEAAFQIGGVLKRDLHVHSCDRAVLWARK